MLWCIIEPAREEKSGRLMKRLAQGWGEPAKVVVGYPPTFDAYCDSAALWGQLWLVQRFIPQCIKADIPFWQIDNGFYLPGANGKHGYHRINYRGLSPIMLRNAPPQRGDAIGSGIFKQWRRDGRHIVLALPGRGFGRSIGLDMDAWIATAEKRIRAYTDREILVREKSCLRPIRDDLAGAWALVTHSSNACVDAAIWGVPAFVEPTAATAPLGNTNLALIERPVLGDRVTWFRSLMCQQFLPAEMLDGTAYKYLCMVRAQVDGDRRDTGAVQAQHR